MIVRAAGIPIALGAVLFTLALRSGGPIVARRGGSCL
jgi:hypothetical protein